MGLFKLKVKIYFLESHKVRRDGQLEVVMGNTPCCQINISFQGKSVEVIVSHNYC